MNITKNIHYKCLSSTSIWILVPGFLCLYNKLYINTLLFVFTCLFSILHWTWYNVNSIRHNLDIFFATTMIIYHSLDLIQNFSNNYFLIFLIANALLFFNLACYYPVGTYKGLISHLLFRYFAYWYVLLNYVKFDYNIYFMNTILYILSIGLILLNCDHICLINIFMLISIYLYSLCLL